jgi:hypothetical protein
MRLIFASALLLFPLCAEAAPSVPNDCWFGVMAADKAPHGQLVATGPVAQWRVGSPVVVYPTKETYEQINALMEKGETGTYDTSQPITVIPTWISGPEPGDKDSGVVLLPKARAQLSAEEIAHIEEHRSIEITMEYRTAEGETGTIMLTYWTPMSGRYPSLPPDQQAGIAQFDQQMHDVSCRGIP